MPLADEASRQTTRCRRLGRVQRDPTPRAGRAMLGLVKNPTYARIAAVGRKGKLHKAVVNGASTSGSRTGGSDPHARFVAPAAGGFFGTGVPQAVDQARCSVNDRGEKVAEWRGACRCPDC